MSNNLISFKVSHASAVSKGIFVNIFVIIVGRLSGSDLAEASIIALVIDVVYIISIIMYIPLEISIDREQRFIYTKVLLWLRARNGSYNVSEITYAYDQEIGGRGTKSRIFKILDSKDKIVFSTGGLYNGWSDDTIREICDTLNSLKVNQSENQQ